MGNYLETLKNITKDKNKRIENLVLMVILLVVVLVSFGYIFVGNKESGANNSTNSSVSNETTQNVNANNDTTGLNGMLESKLSTILSQIVGISDVSVVLTYSQDVKQTPVYNTKETDKTGEKIVEKTVAYNEEDSKKSAIIETVELPKIEGVIVVAKGATTVEMKSKIANAISSVTNVPAYKIQVFEKK